MKNLLYCIIILIQINNISQNYKQILRKHFADLLTVKRVYESIKAVGFKQIKGLDNFSYENEKFIFMDNKSGKKAYFRCAKLKSLFDELNDRTFLEKLFKKSSFYGIRMDNFSSETKEGRNGKSEIYKIEVIIIEYGSIPDDETLIFISDE